MATPETLQAQPDNETGPVADGRNSKNGRFAGKPGPGRKKGSRPKAIIDFIGRGKKYFLSDRYWRNLMQRIERGKAGPQELYIQQMCFGKPKETLQLQNPDGSALSLVQVYLPEKAALLLPRDVVDAEVRVSSARVVVIGGPKAGKSTYAKGLGAAVRCSDPKALGGDADDRLDLPEGERWSAVSAEVAGWLDATGPWTIEGVAVARALRKWMKAHPGVACPVDEVHVLGGARVALTPGQAAMAKGVATVLAEILPWLSATAKVVQVAGEAAGSAAGQAQTVVGVAGAPANGHGPAAVPAVATLMLPAKGSANGHGGNGHG